MRPGAWPPGSCQDALCGPALALPTPPTLSPRSARPVPSRPPCSLREGQRQCRRAALRRHACGHGAQAARTPPAALRAPQPGLRWSHQILEGRLQDRRPSTEALCPARPSPPLLPRSWAPSRHPVPAGLAKTPPLGLAGVPLPPPPLPASWTLDRPHGRRPPPVPWWCWTWGMPAGGAASPSYPASGTRTEPRPGHPPQLPYLPSPGSWPSEPQPQASSL